MSRTVRVKVTSSDAVKTMDEGAAQRLQTINPKEYKILEPPKVDILTLPKLETPVNTEKKSVVDAGAEKPGEKQEEEKPKIGRPKKNP